MIRHLHPRGRPAAAAGPAARRQPAATGVFAGLPGGDRVVHAPGEPTAEHHRWYPNELIVWEGMRRWRDRGAVRFDLGGRDPGARTTSRRSSAATPTTTQWLRRSRFAVLEHGRDAVDVPAARRVAAATSAVSGSGRSTHVD